MSIVFLSNKPAPVKRPSRTSFFRIILIFIPYLNQSAVSQSILCRKQCGDLPIKYPFGIDDGCGNPYFRNVLVCTNNTKLEFRTPSGTYAVTNISYSDPHIVISNPFMWTCLNSNSFPPSRPFSLDSSTPFSLSPLNNFLFFNCSDSVIARPRPSFCERNPDLCDSVCDSSSYLCRNLPGCPSVLERSHCCTYYPTASESLRLMLAECASYTSVYWRFVGATPPYNQVADYGIRVDYDMTVTTHCFECQEPTKGNGICGFDVQSRQFLCLCDGRSSSTYCNGKQASCSSTKVVCPFPGCFYYPSLSMLLEITLGRKSVTSDNIVFKVSNSLQDYTFSNPRAGIIAGTVASVSVSGVIIGVVVWYFKKVKPNRPVACGVQSNLNRLF